MGAVSAILLVPSAVVAPFAAYAGDRFRRDRVLAIDYVVQGLAMGATAAILYADAPGGLVYAAATIASISITFTRPAQNSLLPALTPTPSDLTAANVVSGVVEGMGKTLGPIIAGILLGASGAAAVFAVFAVLTLLGALLVARLRVDVGAVTPEARIDAADIFHETLRGFHTLRRAPEPRLVVLLLSAGVIVVGALDVLFVATAIDLLGIGASGAGYLSAAFGAGAIVGAASTVALVGRRRLTPSLAGGAVLFGRRSAWSPSPRRRSAPRSCSPRPAPVGASATSRGGPCCSGSPPTTSCRGCSASSRASRCSRWSSARSAPPS
jgi:MFS family permease